MIRIVEKSLDFFLDAVEDLIFVGAVGLLLFLLK